MRAEPQILEVELYPWQQHVWNNLPTDALAILSRRAGKTFMINTMAAFTLLLAKEPITIGIFSPTRRKSYELVFEGIRDLLEAKSTSHISFHKAAMEIKNTTTNARLRCYPLSPEHGNACRGDQCVQIFIDEIDLCSADHYYSSVLPTQAGLPANLAPHKSSWCSGTPGGKTSLLTRLYQAYKKQEDTEIFHYPADKLEHISPEELNKLRVTLPADIFQREYMASLEASASDVMFAPMLIANAASSTNATNQTSPSQKSPNQTSPNLTEPDEKGHITFPTTAISQYHPPTAGLDIGNRGDGTVLYIRQHSQPLLLTQIYTDDNSLITRSNMGLQHKQILSLLQRYNCKLCAADASGLGQFFCDELLDLCQPYGIDIHPIAGNQKVPSQHQESYQNLRACLYGLLRKAMEVGHSIPDLHALHEELSAVTIKDDPHTNKILLSPKKEIKAQLGRSPDYSDAVAYSYYFDAQLDLDEYHASLRDISTGTVTISNRELLQRFPEFYENSNQESQSDFFNDSILNQ